MSTGAIDYEALAKQAGATSSAPGGVDYAALAKQAGATGYQPPQQGEKPGFAARASEQMGLTQHPIDQLIGELKQLKDHPVSTLWESVKQPITGLRDLTYNLVRHPVDTVQQVTGGKQFATDVQAGNYRGALGTLAGNAAQVAMMGAPKQTVAAMGAAGDQAGAVASRAALLGKTPEEAYQSALKPSTTLSQAEKANAVRTGLQEGIPISEKGIQKLGALIDQVNAQMDAAVPANSPNTINKFAVTRRLNAPAQKFANQVAPTADLNTIGNVGNDFLETKPGAIPVKDAAAIKSGTYQRIGSRAYGEVGSAQTEAEKALARGIKEELITQFPDLENLGLRDKKLLDLQPTLERAVNRIGNHQLLGIGTPIAAGAAKAVTGSSSVGAVAGLVKAVLDNPSVKSQLAIALSKGGRVGPGQAMAKITAYQSALLRSAGATALSQRESAPSPGPSDGQESK